MRVVFLLFMVVGLTRAEFVPAGGEQGRRREEAMNQLYRAPFPREGAWHFVGRALSSYWTGRGAEGDKAILDLAKTVNQTKATAVGDSEMGFHWQAFQLARLVFLFGKGGVYAPERMSPDAERTAKQLLWEWVEPRAGRALFAPANDWVVWGSENHHLQAWFSFWGAFNLLANDSEYAGRTFADGSSMEELRLAADEYFRRWIRNRATRGIFVECNSPTYAKYSMSGFYNFVDFAKDPELRELARQFLDLCWAQWALEQVNGKRGGSRHRCYAGDASINGGAAEELASYHFHLREPASLHPAAWCTATSSYVPPALVCEIVRDRGKLGNYEIVSRQPGLLDPARRAAIANYFPNATNPMHAPKGNMVLDPDCRSLLRKTYATAGFVFGVSMVPSLPQTDWSPISMQNRWDGVLFRGEGEPSIFVQPSKGTKGAGSLLNSEWSVMDKGVALLQRLPTSNATDQRVWFSASLRLTERDGWIFVEAPEAYAAVRLVHGKGTWEEDKAVLWRAPENFRSGLGKWLVPALPLSPILLEVVPKADYAGLSAFQAEILGNELRVTSQRIDYRSRHYRNELTLFSDWSKPPLIDGQMVVYENPQCFSGGILEGKFGGDRVRLRALGREHVFDFGPARP